MKQIDFSPKYVYDSPMFMITVSVVVIDENGVILVEDGMDTSGVAAVDVYKFPSGIVKAGQESIQFAAVRHLKEQTGILVKKDSLIPVDFRSEPERSESGNVVDIGFVTTIDSTGEKHNGKWIQVDFEEKKLVSSDISQLSEDNQILLQRALDIVLMVKND